MGGTKLSWHFDYTLQNSYLPVLTIAAMLVKITLSMQLFGSSGIRAEVDNYLALISLTVGIILANKHNRIIIGRDTRTSSEAMKHAAVAGMLFGGAKCADASIVPTPTIGFLAHEFEAGVMITASHNPPQYNGIKLLKPNGAGFDAAQRQQIEQALQTGLFQNAPWDKINNSSIIPDAAEPHIERILKDFPGKKKLKIVVECGCGAASLVTPYLLKRMGCEVIALNCYPSGFFPHDVEPTEANLGDLIKTTRELDADVGIAHDGDADRLMAIDDQGRFITGDKLLSILAGQSGAKKVVTTVDASMALEEQNFEVSRTAVGDIYVSELLEKEGDFGGEPSGAWVFPKISLCPDGIYAAAQLINIASQQKLSELADRIPEYPIRRGSVSSNGVSWDIVEKQLLSMDTVSVSKTDGLKLKFADGWLLVRPSGTEPKIRLTVESKTQARVNELYQSVLDTIEKNREAKQ